MCEQGWHLVWPHLTTSSPWQHLQQQQARVHLSVCDSGEHQARQPERKVSGLGARVHTAVLLRHKQQVQEIQT